MIYPIILCDLQYRKPYWYLTVLAYYYVTWIIGQAKTTTTTTTTPPHLSSAVFTIQVNLCLQMSAHIFEYIYFLLGEISVS